MTREFEPMEPACIGCKEKRGTCFPEPCKIWMQIDAVSHHQVVDHWRNHTTVARAVAETKADPNRSYREDALVAEIERLWTQAKSA